LLKNNVILVLSIVAFLTSLYAYLVVPFEWVAVFILMALLYGFLSPSIAARKLFFLAIETPHASLFAIALGILIYRALTLLNEFAWAVIIGVILVNIVGHFISAGVDPDVATSVFVSFTAAGSVLAIYYILSRYSIQYNMWAVVLGDPLLVTQRDIIILAGITLAVVVFCILLHDINVYVGADPDHVKLSLRTLWLYDTAFYTILAISSIALLKLVGFILEHILLSLPAIIASNMTSSSKNAMLVSALSSINSSIIGLLIAVKLDIAPAASIGFIALVLYLASLVRRG
jgi:ABC-type Mn2+/Zn2+ transport system permease subunit